MKYLKDALWVYVAVSTFLVFCIIFIMMVCNGYIPHGMALFGMFMGSLCIVASRAGLVDSLFDKYVEPGDVYVTGSKVRLYVIAGIVVAIMDILLYTIMFMVFYLNMLHGNLLYIALIVMYFTSIFLVRAILIKLNRMKKSH